MRTGYQRIGLSIRMLIRSNEWRIPENQAEYQRAQYGKEEEGLK